MKQEEISHSEEHILNQFRAGFIGRLDITKSKI